MLVVFKNLLEKTVVVVKTNTVTLSIHSRQEIGWVLHVDPETGVKGRFWTQPIELQWDWDYTPQEW